MSLKMHDSGEQVPAMTAGGISSAVTHAALQPLFVHPLLEWDFPCIVNRNYHPTTDQILQV